MNLKAFGWLIVLLGLLGGLGTGYHYISLDRAQTRASVAAVMAYTGYANLDTAEARLRGNAAKDAKQRLVPWMIGAGVVALVGLCVAVTARDESSSQRLCPKCAERVQVKALVCKHCGADLEAIDAASGYEYVEPDEDDLDESVSESPSDTRAYSYRELAKAAERAETRAKT